MSKRRDYYNEMDEPEESRTLLMWLWLMIISLLG